MQTKAAATIEELFEVGSVRAGETLPLVLRPREAGFDAGAWVREQREFIDASLLEHGGVLFRKLDIGGEADFERFARAFSPELMDYLDQHTPRSKLSGFVYTSTEYPADHFIPFHSENSRNTTWPLRIWFCCVRPAERGGETPIADNRKVFGLLDPGIRRRFMEKNVMYLRNLGEGAGLSWQTVFQTSDPSVVEEICRREQMEWTWKDAKRLRLRHVAQAVARHPRTGEMVWFNQAHLFHVASLDPSLRESLLMLFDEEELPSNAYYGDGSPIEDSVIEEIQEAYRQASVTFAWEPRDVLMLENTLAAHARTPYTGTRQVLVAMAEPYQNQAAAQTPAEGEEA